MAAFSPEAAFLPALANAWLATGGDSSEGLIILPSRRSARALAGAFLQANQGKSLLLPRIIAFGAIDETALTIAEGLTLPPAVPAMVRQTLLTKLILARQGAKGAPTKLASAWTLAGDLARLLDEADAAEIDLKATLPNLVSAELAAHWQTTLAFLEIITANWPTILGEMGVINPVDRLRRLIDAQNAAWQARPPAEKVWMVTRDATPALARLAKTIVALPQGAVILPGYDTAMGEDAWDSVDDSHAQKSIDDLLTAIGARHSEIEIWPPNISAVPTGRAAFLSRALLPAPSLGAWQDTNVAPISGLFRLTTRDEHEEATAIAMALRDTLEHPGRSAALITPDRNLALRVKAVLQRFGIEADDSAGDALAASPPAVFLRLLADAAASEFSPVPLLALLKHPLTAAGEPAALCREHARLLEVAALRGPRPPPGFVGIKYQLEKNKNTNVLDFLVRLEKCLAPLIGMPVAVNPAQALIALVTAAEDLAATDSELGAARLWSGEAGTMLSDLMLEILNAFETLPDIVPADVTSLLDAVLAGPVVRKPRTKDNHPRIAIWGVQEASLQTVDVAVLAGLVESVWPAPAEPGPWLNRPMRKAARLPPAEKQISQEAHEFFSLSCRCPVVILSAPIRTQRAPAVPARWITRIDALLAGRKTALPPHPAQSWATQLDVPLQRVMRPKPSPKPPVASRPTELSISDIATLMADPYAIYAQKILKLYPLDALDGETDASQFGEIVHDGLATFFEPNPDVTASDATEKLTLSLQTAMRNRRPRAALQHWWDARLQRIAGWIVEAERQRRQTHQPPQEIGVERAGTMKIGQKFALKGRVDRIEQRADGGIFIMDYKTGKPPSAKDVAAGSAPQLPLEAVMAQDGAFGAQFKGDIAELAFWQLSGRHVVGNEKPLFEKSQSLSDIIQTAQDQLPVLFEKFSKPDTAYLAAPHPGRKTYDDPYLGISRRREWGGSEDSDDGA
ncbi:MAG: double-strand break repair protein AddB [Acidocella sp. 20-57-95]|nr:MAG: double-strand break repair protein AddB [Acidocella sp. 20-57-95]